MIFQYINTKAILTLICTIYYIYLFIVLMLH